MGTEFRLLYFTDTWKCINWPCSLATEGLSVGRSVIQRQLAERGSGHSSATPAAASLDCSWPGTQCSSPSNEAAEPLSVRFYGFMNNDEISPLVLSLLRDDRNSPTH